MVDNPCGTNIVHHLFDAFYLNCYCWAINVILRLSFLLSTIFYFYFFSHITHSIQNMTKQNNRHILNISRSNQKGVREGRTTRTQKSILRLSWPSLKRFLSINWEFWVFFLRYRQWYYSPTSNVISKQSLWSLPCNWTIVLTIASESFIAILFCYRSLKDL